jgi:CRP/FNR family cyclic AMP-dependent transcriptional regulator
MGSQRATMSLGRGWRVSGRHADDVTRAMRAHELFAEIPDDLLAGIAEMGRVRNYRAATYVTMQGDPSRAVYLLLAGSLEISTASPASGPQLQGRITPVRLFGELGVLADVERTASVLCLEESRIWVLEREPFLSLVGERPALAGGLLRALARQVIAKEGSAEDLVWLDLKGRLAKRLLTLATTEGPDGDLVVPPVTQADLAALCGVSRESVSKTLVMFGRRGLVRREGRRYVLLDPEALHRFAQG